MGKDLLLGIDIGTSGCKTALFAVDGRVAGEEKEEYPVYYPEPGFVEQDPQDWWTAVCRSIKRLIKKSGVDPKDIAGVGVDGQSWAAIAVDETGGVLTRNPIWMDTRSQKICDQINKEIGEDTIFSLSGNPLKAQYTTGKILWYKQNKPEIYKKINKILQSNSYIVFRLTGEITQDISQGYGIHCFDMRNGRWDQNMGDALGLNMDMLPEISACHDVVGRVTKTSAQMTGLVPGTPVVAGGLDAACGTLGAGVIDSGQTQEQGGQAGGMSICIDEYCAVKNLILSYHVAPEKWLLQGGTTGGGGICRWFEEQFGFEERAKAEELGVSSLKLLDDLAETIPAGSGGVVFLPYMAGERSPIWDENAKGVFYGLGYNKTRGHLARAALEGVAYSLRHNLVAAAEAGADVKTMRAMGGAANSRLWTQIKADVTGKPIEVPASDTATTLGAAILAGVGVGVYRDFDEAVKTTVQVKRRHEPNQELYETYTKGYQVYRELYESLKHLMRG